MRETKSYEKHTAASVLHDVDCTCAEFGVMRCAMREDWFEGNDPTDWPPPTPMNRWQHDPDGMAAWARSRRRSILPWIRRRAHRAIQYAIYHREIALGWRRVEYIADLWPHEEHGGFYCPVVIDGKRSFYCVTPNGHAGNLAVEAIDQEGGNMDRLALEHVVAQVLNILEREYDIEGVEDLGSPTAQEIARRIAGGDDGSE